jgi:hypothetical protein
MFLGDNGQSAGNEYSIKRIIRSSETTRYTPV